MYSIGDSVFYNANGVCVIEEIKEQSFTGQSRLYYTLRSKRNPSIQLYHPVDSKDSKLTNIASKQNAQLILDTFKKPANEWLDRATARSHQYQDILKTNDHVRIAQMMNSILRKRIELKQIDKKLPAQDDHMLQHVSPILYEELSISLNIPYQEVVEKIEIIISENL